MDERTVAFCTCTAFAGNRSVASGKLAEVAAKAKETLDRGEQATLLIFDDSTGGQVEVDFRGTIDDVLARLETPTAPVEPAAAADRPSPAPRGPGRPKLGVVAREVTLLPRHWEWLNNRPGGASVALRKLVDEARHANLDRDRVRNAQEVAHRFMFAITGDMPGFEEATRALFAGDSERFYTLIASWPIDIREYVRKLSAAAFPDQAGKNP